MLGRELADILADAETYGTVASDDPASVTLSYDFASGDGTHTWSLVVSNGSELSSASSTVELSTTPPPDCTPTVALSSPASGSSYDIGSPPTATATLSVPIVCDLAGFNVGWLLNKPLSDYATSIDALADADDRAYPTGTSASISWSPVPTSGGATTYGIVLTDGTYSGSEEVDFTLTTPCVVAITSPTSGYRYSVGDALAVTASMSGDCADSSYTVAWLVDHEPVSGTELSTLSPVTSGAAASTVTATIPASSLTGDHALSFGTYLTASPSSGQFAVDTISLDANTSPLATLTFPTTATVSPRIGFVGTATFSDTDGTVTSASVSCGGSVVAAGTASPLAVSVSPSLGTTVCTLTVTDDMGESSTDSETLTVTNDVPVITITGQDQERVLFDGTSASESTIVYFEATDTYEPSSLSFACEAGGATDSGTMASGDAAQCELGGWTATGSHTITLNVTDGDGGVGTDTSTSVKIVLSNYDDFDADGYVTATTDLDFDGDGVPDLGGGDCDDYDATVYPTSGSDTCDDDNNDCDADTNEDDADSWDMTGDSTYATATAVTATSSTSVTGHRLYSSADVDWYLVTVTDSRTGINADIELTPVGTGIYQLALWDAYELSVSGAAPSSSNIEMVTASADPHRLSLVGDLSQTETYWYLRVSASTWSADECDPSSSYTLSFTY